MNRVDPIEKPRLRDDLPDFRAGDTVRVHVRVVEGGRERVQVFQGVVIRRRGGGIRESFTARKMSFGVGVERTFPLHSPSIAKIEVLTRGDVRRAKLYYLRERRGKRARIRELRTPIGAAPLREPAEASDAPEAAEPEAPEEPAAAEPEAPEEPVAAEPEASEEPAAAQAEAEGEE